MGRWARTLVSALAVLMAAADAPARADQAPPERADVVQALSAFRAGYVLHMSGRFEEATEQYRRSIAHHPTAEAHTFLGWSLSYLGRLEEAIAECKAAIEIDPDFGNPYNDIGVYLIDLDRPEESIPWLRKAIAAPRYCCYQFAHYNLGRALMLRDDIEQARRAFRRALEHDPGYAPARAALELLDTRGIRGL